MGRTFLLAAGIMAGTVTAIGSLAAQDLADYTDFLPARPGVIKPYVATPDVFLVGCYEWRSGKPKDCEVSFQSTFHVPDDVDLLYWTGGHLHPPGQLDDPSRPIGALCSEIDPGQCDPCPPDDPHANEPRAFHGWSAGSYWRAVKTIPQVGGMVTMTATVIHPPGYRCVPSGQWICDHSDPTMRTSRAVVGFDVRVPDLVELPSNLELYWRCGDTATCSSGDNEDVHHPRAFFGAPRMIDAVEQLAADFQNAYPTLRLRLTDMSLPWGGLFDFRENWTPTPGHIWHRHGIDVDVATAAASTDGTLVELSQDQLDKLDELACAVRPVGLRRYEKEVVHYRREGCKK